ncbi:MULTISPECIES: hypothetical protein [unclassified Wenzhouxiangella]|uniref:hypothetical protein n=1 Tax=unclassified Wenzhouxiangella TaxID=2613841 RepID=UPI000E325881|nr:MULTISPECIES: hypothetical protein [unclassified Wenzhouxiangella]RFF27853.1 hypothetical protein DZK25_05575 [Wenzhouxiangella sp. 15181]RFP69020.1 hypothetical protein DZK26_05890 [Wenzhouxiangella sp. 15190]
MAEQETGSDTRERSTRVIDLWRLVWAVRVPVLIVLLAFTVVFWAVAFFYKTPEQPVYTWQSQIQFTFSGIDDGQYPDGTPFTSADLVSPVVLEQVHAELDLAEQGIELDEFSDMLTVAAHAPRRDELMADFRRRLGNDLSTAETAELEEDFLARLERITRGQVKLTLTTRHEDLPAGDILAAIPRTWSNYVRDEFGAFAADLPLYTVDVIDDSRALEMDFLLTYDALKETFRRLNDNLEMLEEQPNSGQVEDPETGMGLADVRALSGELEEFVLENAISPSLAFGLSSRPELTVWFFENRIEALERQRQLMTARGERVGEVLDDYLEQQYAMGSSEAGSSATMQAAGIGSGFLQRLVQLGANRGDTGFRQELSRERLDYTMQAAELEAEIRRVRELIALIESQEDSDFDSPEREGDSLQEQIEEMIASVRELYEVTGRIAHRMNTMRFGGEQAIYNVVETSDSPGSTNLVFHSANLARYLLGLVIVLLAATLGLAVLLAVRRQARSSNY